MMSLPDVSHPFWFFIVTLLVFFIIMGRYVLIAGIFYSFFYLLRPVKWEQRKLSSKGYRKKQFRKEITWSCITAIIFSVITTFAFLLWQLGYTKVYTNIYQYPLWWLPVSLVLSLLLHETYYYWLHRWMHHPSVFKLVHKVHHDSNITSPWTAFSFHPLEGLLQSIFLPLVLLVMPVHLYILIIQLTVMSLSSVINHLDIEVYPKNFHRHFIGRWLIGATHHSLHHRHFKFNYGLYFTFWDKWRKTESPLYEKLFEEKTSTISTSHL
jgi:lathosterol oxidase